MRRISLTPLDSLKWKRWITDCQKESKKLLDSLTDGEKPNFKAKLYKRKSIKEEFFFNKGSPFYGKCAYCEAYITDFQHGDIEHFRPKGGVTDEHDEPIYLHNRDGKPVLDEKGNPKAHPGYYWLAYDWTNLLPSCAVCNQPKLIGGKKIGKHNRFPVLGFHAISSADIETEQPLLINPASFKEEDSPSKHLAIDVETGLMIPLSDRGRTCIEIFGLNHRDQLVKARCRAIREAQWLIIQLVKNNKPEIIEEIKVIHQGYRSHTVASLAILAKFIES